MHTTHALADPGVSLHGNKYGGPYSGLEMILESKPIALVHIHIRKHKGFVVQYVKTADLPLCHLIWYCKSANMQPG